MSELTFIFIVIIWYGLSLYISETKGKTFRFGMEWLFFISMVFSPILGIIATFVFNIKTKEQVLGS